MSEKDKYSDHQSGMPNAAYFRMMEEQEYGWTHRGEPNPMEGFKHSGSVTEPGTTEITPDSGTIVFTPQSVVEPEGQLTDPIARLTIDQSEAFFGPSGQINPVYQPK